MLFFSEDHESSAYLLIYLIIFRIQNLGKQHLYDTDSATKLIIVTCPFKKSNLFSLMPRPQVHVYVRKRL